MARLNLVVVRSRDATRLASFYTEMGLTFVQHQHGPGPKHFASESNDGVFEIYPLGSNSEPTTKLRMGFGVEDLTKTVPRLLAAGANW